MNRRNFIKTISAAPLALTASSFAAKEQDPETVDELISWFERTYACEIGNFTNVTPIGNIDVAYTTHVIMAPADTPDRDLVRAMYKDFASAGGTGSQLRWRYSNKIKITIEEESIGFDDVGPDGQLRETVKVRQLKRLRTRIAAPEVNCQERLLFKPEGEKPRYMGAV